MQALPIRVDAFFFAFVFVCFPFCVKQLILPGISTIHRMNILEQLQEKYIQEFTQNVPFDEFLVNILITAFLASALRWFYIRYGSAITNRRRFAANFLPLALGTLLIIMIVKSSIALSLGLVGALSIVRYRAAIKEPEELTFLFIAIGLGLAGGANQPLLGTIAFVLITGLLYLSIRLSGRRPWVHTENKLLVHIQSESKDLERFSELLTSRLPYVELRRMDIQAKGMELTFMCKAEQLSQLAAVKDAIAEFAPEARLSIIEQPDLVI